MQRWDEVQAELNRGPKPAVFAQLSKEFAELNPVVATIRALQQGQDANGTTSSRCGTIPPADKELAALAREELAGAPGQASRSSSRS